MHPKMQLPLYNKVLDDQVGLGKLDYERTIRTAELLGLHDHETATISHDGTVFVIAHQCQELKIKLAVHELAIRRLGWDAVHRRLGITRAFYDRFTPAISARDFALREGGDARLAGALDFVAVCRT